VVGHRRPNNGVASLAYVPAITPFVPRPDTWRHCEERTARSAPISGLREISKY
jgi:hypothetical protein